MSKLTNWLDNDELDVQGIVDKYEQELIKEQNNKLNNVSNEHDTCEIWSGNIDDNELKPTSLNTKKTSVSNKTIEFNIIDSEITKNNNVNESKPRQEEQQSSRILKNKTISFTQVNNDNIEIKPTTPPPPPPFKKQTPPPSFVKPTTPPPPPPIKKPANVVNEQSFKSVSKEKTVLFNNDAFDKTESTNQCIDMKNVDTRILKTDQNSKKTKLSTIIFKNNTAELKPEEKKSSKEPNNHFNDLSSFRKNLEENDYKTAKFQPEENEIIINEPVKNVKCENVDNKCVNNFEPSLTKIFFNETQKAESLELTKEFNQADAIDIDESKTTKKKRKASSKNDEKIKYKTKVPQFIKLESKFLLLSTIISFVFLFCSFGLIGYITYLFLSNLQSPYLYIPSGLLTGIFAILSFVNLYRYNKLHKEIKDSNYEINKELPLISLKNIYKRLIVANINLNWCSGLIYTLCLLGILLTYIVTYFMNLINYQVNDFGNLIVNGDNTPLITMWTQAGIIFALIPTQLTLFFINKHRMNNMNMYYQKEIISDEMVMKYQKQARKKWKIIYISIVAVVGIVILITWLVLRRKAKK